MKVMFFPSVQPSAWRLSANACQALSAVGSAVGATPRTATRAGAASAVTGQVIAAPPSRNTNSRRLMPAPHAHGRAGTMAQQDHFRYAGRATGTGWRQ